MLRKAVFGALLATVFLLSNVAGAPHGELMLADRPFELLESYPVNVTMIIRDYGYPCEEYVVLTKDGYILTLQRIPHGKTRARARGVVLYQHGLIDNANGVVLNPPHQALPFILADAGYDVWLGNNRGSGYSMHHLKWNVNDPEFWQFSWDEMAIYDLPATIDFILEKTGVSQLSYIGHSEGTIQAFAGFEDSVLASKVNIFIALAPVVTVGSVRSTILRVLAELNVDQLFVLLGINEFSLGKIIKKIIPEICRVTPKVCENFLDTFMGPSKHLNGSRMNYYMHYEPNPTSVKNIAHWSQGIKSKTFQRFDYGRDGNLKHYNQTTPPPWKLSALPETLPIALFTGGNDYLAGPTDVKYIIQNLPVPPVLIHDEPTYAHVDFLWAVDANVRIYPLVLNLLNHYN